MTVFGWRRAITFVEARVLGPDGSIGSTLRIARGVVVDVGVAPKRGDLVVACDGAVVLPGLINAHDHLQLNSFGRLKWRERYENVAEWIADFQPRFATDPALADARSNTVGDRWLIGALKNLLSGVTTVCHHDPLPRIARWRLPLRVVRRFGFSHSVGLDGDRVRDSFRKTPADWPWIIHAAEGVDSAAAGELSRLGALGCIGPTTAIVHGIAMTPPDREGLINRGGSLVWCPGSNHFLFGATAQVKAFARVGRLALGSDSRLSGETDLLAELRAAQRTGQLDNRALMQAVTCSAATVLRLQRVGRLAPGALADVTVVAPRRSDPVDALLAARRSDIKLTLIGGRPVIGDMTMAPVFAATGVASAPVCLDGSVRLMNRALAGRVSRLPRGEPGLQVDA